MLKYFKHGKSMWKNKFAKYILEKFILQQGTSDSDKIVYLYGLSAGITILENIVITLILGYIFGNLIQTMIFLLSYVPLRSYAGGYHAKTEQVCFIFSTLLIIVVEIFFSNFFRFNYVELMGFVIISIFLIVINSPFESEKKSLSNGERKFYKRTVKVVLGLESIVILICVVNKQSVIFSGIAAAIFSEAILITFGSFVNRIRGRK